MTTSRRDLKMIGSLATALRRQRAEGARDYSFREDVRRNWRDGFTAGWEAAKRDSRLREETARRAE